MLTIIKNTVATSGLSEQWDVPEAPCKLVIGGACGDAFTVNTSGIALIQKHQGGTQRGWGLRGPEP